MGFLNVGISDVSICNMALARCGVTLFIESADELSQQSDVCNLFYVPVRDRVLQAFPWPFARQHAALADVGNPPTNWGYRYAYPTGCLKIRDIVQGGSAIVQGYSMYPQDSVYLPVRIPYQIILAADGNSKTICTNVENAEVEYTARVTDVTMFPQSFINALAWALAAEIAIPLTTDMNRATLAQNMCAKALLEAGADELNEEAYGPMPESDFIKARR